jgi:hypothetical protein
MSDLLFELPTARAEDFVGWFFDSFEPIFVPDMHPSRDFPRYARREDVWAIVQSHLAEAMPCRFFVLSDRWTSLPLSMTWIVHKDGRPPLFYIDQHYGGPAFDFLMRPARAGDRDSPAVAGWLMDYSYYYRTPGSPDTIDRPAGMADAFKKAKAWMRRERALVDRKALTRSSQTTPGLRPSVSN